MIVHVLSALRLRIIHWQGLQERSTCLDLTPAIPARAPNMAARHPASKRASLVCGTVTWIETMVASLFEVPGAASISCMTDMQHVTDGSEYKNKS